MKNYNTKVKNNEILKCKWRSKMKYLTIVLMMVANIFAQDDERRNEHPETGWFFEQSTQQAFYFFDTVLLNDSQIDSEDWVGAYNGDICVGARKWDISQCSGGVCDIPVFGYDGNDLSSGYMSVGDLPTFKVFKASILSYHDVFPSDNEPWESFGTWIFDSLSECTNGAQFCDK